MKTLLPATLYGIDTIFFKRAHRRCMRYMSGYRLGLQGPLLDYATRMYRGHRCIPLFVDNAVNELKPWYDAHREKNEIKRELG